MCGKSAGSGALSKVINNSIKLKGMRKMSSGYMEQKDSAWQQMELVRLYQTRGTV